MMKENLAQYRQIINGTENSGSSKTQSTDISQSEMRLKLSIHCMKRDMKLIFARNADILADIFLKKA